MIGEIPAHVIVGNIPAELLTRQSATVEDRMVVTRPYRRTVRQFSNGRYPIAGTRTYISHPKLSSEAEHYIRAFFIIQKDLIELFDYIEPANTNNNCYSYRIHELFMKTCIGVEANFKAILFENTYRKRKNLTIMITKRRKNLTVFRSIV
jgi:hypothetical protein